MDTVKALPIFSDEIPPTSLDPEAPDEVGVAARVGVTEGEGTGLTDKGMIKGCVTGVVGVVVALVTDIIGVEGVDTTKRDVEGFATDCSVGLSRAWTLFMVAPTTFPGFVPLITGVVLALVISTLVS